MTELERAMQATKARLEDELITLYRAYLLDKARHTITTAPMPIADEIHSNGAVIFHRHEAHQRYAKDNYTHIWNSIAWWREMSKRDQLKTIASDTDFLAMVNNPLALVFGGVGSEEKSTNE